MRVIVCDNYDEVSQKAYEIFEELLVNKPNCVLGLATGSSPIGLYQNLIKAYQNNKISFKDVITFNLDEYVGIELNHPESYHSFMHKQLFDSIDINEKNIHLPYGSTNADCLEYDNMMKDYQIDLQVLGIGSNGHIGFNEPGTPFDINTHIVDLKQSTINDNARFFENDINLVPKQAITMGINNIMQSKKIVLIATGIKKANAIKMMVEGKVDINCPASILQQHNDVTVIIDKEAASMLENK